MDINQIEIEFNLLDPEEPGENDIAWLDKYAKPLIDLAKSALDAIERFKNIQRGIKT